MIKYITLFIVLLVLSTATMANERINNYEKQLITASGQERIEPLAELAKYYSQENPKRSLLLGKEAKRLLQIHTNYSRELFVDHYLVMAYFELSQFTPVEALLPAYKDLAMTEGTIDQKALYYKDESYLINFRDANYEASAKLLKKALELYQQMPDDTPNIHLAIGATMSDIGLKYYYNDQFDEALEFYYRALDIENYAVSIYATRVFGNIGLIYQQMKRYDESLHFFEQALSFAKKFKSKALESEQSINMGTNFLSMKRYDDALTFFAKARELEVHLGNKRNAYLIEQRSGEVFRETEKYEKAEQSFAKALQHANDMGTKRFIAETELSLGKAQIQLKQYQNALVHLKESLALTQAIELEAFESQSHQFLAITYQKLGQHELAYHHLVEHYKIRELRLEKDRIDKVSELEEQFKAKQRESQIDLLTKDNELQALLVQEQRIMAVTVFLIIATFFIVVLLRQRQKRKLDAERADLMAELVEKKNQLLADVSHELRTPLTVLQLKVEALQNNLVKNVDASYDGLMAKINDINHLIGDIYQLAQSDIGALQLQIDEFNCLDLLSRWSDEFEDATVKQGFTWQQTLDIPENTTFSCDKGKLKQVLSNLIDNSYSYTDKPGKIALSVSQNDSSLFVTIEDSAPSVNESELKNIFERLYRVEGSRSRATGGSGLGLSICKSIVKAHQGEIKAAKSSLGGISIIISLPLSGAV